MRKVSPAGTIVLLNESWPVGRRWSGHYVRATIDTARQPLALWHQPEAQAKGHRIKTRHVWLKETGPDLLPALRHKSARCREQWPG